MCTSVNPVGSGRDWAGKTKLPGRPTGSNIKGPSVEKLAFCRLEVKFGCHERRLQSCDESVESFAKVGVYSLVQGLRAMQSGFESVQLSDHEDLQVTGVKQWLFGLEPLLAAAK